MIPEIKVLHEHSEGRRWNSDTQIEFIKKLSEDFNFEGEGSIKNMDFSARDRINRGPKALGFVDLKPTIRLTAPGSKLINDKRVEEILLR